MTKRTSWFTPSLTLDDDGIIGVSFGDAYVDTLLDDVSVDGEDHVAILNDIVGAGDEIHTLQRLVDYLIAKQGFGCDRPARVLFCTYCGVEIIESDQEDVMTFEPVSAADGFGSPSCTVGDAGHDWLQEVTA